VTSGTRNLTRADAAERARLLQVSAYDVALDLTDGAGDPGGRTFRSRTTVTFGCSRPGASTFIEIAADTLHVVTLNGNPVDTSGWSAERGLTLTGLAAHNVLVVDAEFPYSTAGQGLNRTVDPVDGETYLYTHFEPAEAQRVFAAFDQPDLKARFTWHATVPRHWRVVSTMPAERVDRDGPGKTVHFPSSPRMSTYLAALCAGPYHRVTATHDGIELGLYCRASMGPHLDADDILAVTKRGFDSFHARFGERYPLPKYDQVFVPGFNSGAMENLGCVTLSEDRFVLRSAATDADRDQRAATILHELAHFWFGDLVTMRWWDDLWLKEAFATWAAYLALADGAVGSQDPWATFLAVYKSWGYRQDQLSSTHPVCSDLPDVEATKVSFDGIAYAKGAAIIKQMAAYVGTEAFTAGLRAYFARHRWDNAGLDDLVKALENASGRSVRGMAAEWLETAQVNTLRALVRIDEDGRYASAAIEQQAPDGYPTLRTHRLAVGLYDLHDGRLRRRERLELDVAGAVTTVADLSGRPAADLLLVNDDDLTYAKIRFDGRSLATLRGNVWRLESPLARTLCWGALWDMVRDAELAARDFVTMALEGLAHEDHLSLVTVLVGQVTEALASYAAAAWAPRGWDMFAARALRSLHEAAAGSGTQLAWARTYAAAARNADDLHPLRNWLAGAAVPDGLVVDADLRWRLLHRLVANDAAGPADIDAELSRDGTASGEAAATTARALIPTAEAKADAWLALTQPDELPNWRAHALARGFQHAGQHELTAPYAARFFADVVGIWQRRGVAVARTLIPLIYPRYGTTEATVAATDDWLADRSQPAPLRRRVAESRDDLVRALAARTRDAASATG
jgi:aminopeptidase N